MMHVYGYSLVTTFISLLGPFFTNAFAFVWRLKIFIHKSDTFITLLFCRFDHFNIIRQGLLLAIDTFGVSHILPILSIPFIITLQLQNSKENSAEGNTFLYLTQVI